MPTSEFTRAGAPSVSGALAVCRDEVLVVESGRGAVLKEVLRETLPRGDGSRVRVLATESLCRDATVHTDLMAAQRGGGEVRTTANPCGDLLVVDRKIAFVPWCGASPWLALHECRAMTNMLGAMFDTLWRSATFFDGSRDEAADPRKVILWLLARGHKDEAIARKLDISVRTCRRRIAEILADVGAESRFQAGYLAAYKHGELGL